MKNALKIIKVNLLSLISIPLFLLSNVISVLGKILERFFIVFIILIAYAGVQIIRSMVPGRVTGFLDVLPIIIGVIIVLGLLFAVYVVGGAIYEGLVVIIASFLSTVGETIRNWFGCLFNICSRECEGKDGKMSAAYPLYYLAKGLRMSVYYICRYMKYISVVLCVLALPAVYLWYNSFSLKYFGTEAYNCFALFGKVDIGFFFAYIVLLVAAVFFAMISLAKSCKEWMEDENYLYNQAVKYHASEYDGFDFTPGFFEYVPYLNVKYLKNQRKNTTNPQKSSSQSNQYRLNDNNSNNNAYRYQNNQYHNNRNQNNGYKNKGYLQNYSNYQNMNFNSDAFNNKSVNLVHIAYELAGRDEYPDNGFNYNGVDISGKTRDYYLKQLEKANDELRRCIEFFEGNEKRDSMGKARLVLETVSGAYVTHRCKYCENKVKAEDRNKVKQIFFFLMVFEEYEIMDRDFIEQLRNIKDVGNSAVHQMTGKKEYTYIEKNQPERIDSAFENVKILVEKFKNDFDLD